MRGAEFKTKLRGVDWIGGDKTAYYAIADWLTGSGG